MKLNFERFEKAQQQLASISIYPIAKWNVKDGDESAFRSVKLDLRTNPASDTSPKFSSYFKVFESGTPEQWCRWREDLTTVFRGLALTTGPTQAGMIRHLLNGQARDTFNEFFENRNNTETPENVEKALKKVAATLFPDSAVTNQKQYLRHELKKPGKLTARETSTRLLQLNAWLSYYPADGEDPAAAVTKLDEIELRDIYYRLLPANWRRKMDENVNFDRNRDGLKGLVEYAERLEVIEVRFEGKPKENNTPNDKGRDGNKKADGHSKKGKSETGRANSDGNRSMLNGSRDCLVHGPGCGHSSHKCKILIDHAQKVKGQFKASFKDNKVHKKSSNAKPWKKDNNDRVYSKKEVQMLLKKTSERLKKEKDEFSDMEEEVHLQEDIDTNPGTSQGDDTLEDLLKEMGIE